jgi:DNA-binding transcriptional LysR family regulator
MAQGMNLRRIDLNLLVVFEAVVAEGSVSRAARRLHLSQPALSHSLARLREAFGDPILVRHGRGMEATAVALAALPEVRAILAQVSRVFSHAGRFDPARSERTVHLGVSDYATVAVLPKVFARIRREAPALRLHLHHAGRTDVPGLLRAGQLDLALGVFNTLTADLASMPLLEEPYLCAMAGARPPKTQQEYLDAEHLNVLVSGDTLGLVDEALARRGLARRIVLTVPHFAAAPALLAGTGLVYTGPAGFLKQAGMARALRCAPVPLELPPFRTQLAWPLRTQDDEALRWLRSCFSEAFAG